MNEWMKQNKNVGAVSDFYISDRFDINLNYFSYMPNIPKYIIYTYYSIWSM